jgi:hypothetical protein
LKKKESSLCTGACHVFSSGAQFLNVGWEERTLADHSNLHAVFIEKLPENGKNELGASFSGATGAEKL